MSDSLPVNGPLRGPAAPSGVERKDQAASKATGDAPAFRALLERLERQAGDLEQKSRAELPPEELREAVDAARASMRDALALQEELLEAWRQARTQSGGGPAGGGA